MQQRNQKKLGLCDSGPELNIKMKNIETADNISNIVLKYF